MLPRRGGQLTIPSPATVRAPGISRRTGAPRTVDPLPSSRIVVLDVDGNPVESIPQEDEVAPETLGQASVPDSTSLTPTGSLSRNSASVSLPPGYTTALLRGGFAVVCSVCSVGLPKYSCPKCSAPLCSLECYRAPAHGDGCAERFYEGEVRAAMGTARAVPGERDALLRVLQRADAAAAARGEGSISSAHGATGDGDDEDDVPLPEPVPTSVPRRRLAAPAHANAHAPMPASGPGSAPASVAAAEDEGGVGDSPKQQQQQQQQQQKQVLPPLSPTAAARLLSLAQAGALTIEALTPHERACFRASETVASVAAPAAATASDATSSCGADNVSTPADLASVLAAAASGQEETPSADGRSAGVDSSACNRGWWYSRPPQSPLDGPVHGPMPAGSAPLDASKWDLSGDSSNDSVSSLFNVGASTETTSATGLHNASASGANVASANTVGRVFTVRPPPGAGPVQVWPLPPLPLALVQGQEQQGQECASGARGVGSVRLPWFLPGLPPEWVTAAKDAAAAASAAAAAAAAEAEPGVANSPSEPSAGVMPSSVSGPTLSSVTPGPTAAAAVTAAAAAAGEAAAATVISNYIMDIEFFGTGIPPSTRKAASSAESAAQEQGQQQQQELEAEPAPLPPPLPQVVPRLSAVAAGVRVHAPPYPFLPSSQQPESERAGMAKVEDAAHEGPWLLALPSKYIEHVNSASPHSMFKGQSPRVLSPLLVLHIAELLLAYAHVTRTRSTDEEGGLTLMKGAEAASDVEVLLSVSACIRSALAPVATAPASGENTRANSDRALLAGAGNAAGAAYLFNSACDTIATRTRAAFAAAATASAVAAGGAVTGVVVSGAAAAGAAEATASLFDTAVILSHPLRCLRALAHILGMVTLAAAHVQASSAVSTPVSAPIPAPARAPAPAPPAAAAAPAVTVNSASTPANGVSARSNESSDSHGRGRGRGGRALRGARGGLSSVAEGNARSLAAAQGVLRSSKSAVDVVSVRVRRLERVAQKVEFLMAAVAEHVAATTVPTANRKMPSVTKARGVAVLEEEQESMVGTAKARASDMRGRGCCKGKGCASAAALYQAALTPKALALAQEENRCNTCSLFAPPASSTSGLTAAAAAAVEAVSSDCATIAGLVPVVPLPLGLPFVESLSPNSVAAKAAAAAAGVPLYQQGGALTPLCCKCTRLTNPKMASVVSSPEEVGDGEQGEGLGWLEQADSCQRSSPSVLPPLPLPVIEPVLSAAAAAAATEAEATAMDRTADAERTRKNMLSPRSPGGAFPFLSPRATTNSQHHSDVSTSSAAGGPNGLTEIDASFLISRIRNRVKELATDLSYTKKAEQAARDDSRKLYERIALLEQELATEKANSIAATNKLQLLETLSVSDNASSAAATSSSSSSTTGEERARREATRLRELNSSLQADLVSLRAAAIEHAAAASEWEHTRAQLQSRISTQSSLIDDLQATCRTTQDALSATKITSAEFDAIVSEFRAAASASALRSVNDDTRVQELRLEGARLTRALEAAQSDLVTAARAQAQAEADRDEARARAAASKEAAEAAETAVTGAAGVRAQMSQALARVAQLEKVLVGFLPPPPPPSAPSIVSAPSSAVTPAAATIISSPTISAAAAAGAAPESPTREPQAKRPCPPLRHSQTRQVETSSEAATAGANTAKSSSTEKETDVLRDGSDDMPPLESLPAPIMTSEKSV